jgi:hypothetical protein
MVRPVVHDGRGAVHLAAADVAVHDGDVAQR